MVKWLQIRDVEFTSLPENINIIESLVVQLKSEWHLSDQLEANILVALSEAVNNAIFHGNQQSPLKKVKVKFVKNKRKISFSVEDEGLGFNPLRIKNPTNPENIDKPAGRGIFLMQHLADQAEFIDGGRKVILTFFQ